MKIAREESEKREQYARNLIWVHAGRKYTVRELQEDLKKQFGHYMNPAKIIRIRREVMKTYYANDPTMKALQEEADKVRAERGLLPSST